MTLRNKLKAINNLAYDITWYDIVNWPDYKSPEEAIDEHLNWLENHFIDIRQSFENETRKYRGDLWKLNMKLWIE